MRCDVVAVGTELLLGQIVDTNSSWIGEQLALAGIDSLRQTKVGDNLDRIVAEIDDAVSRADAVVVCGGLGPTQDDITRDAIARVMGVELDLDEAVAARIEAMFGGRGRRMPANNYRQAEVPRGATAIADPQPGTAPGLICPLTRPGPDGEPVAKVIYAVPGVPYEMKAIMAGAILPDLRERAGVAAVIRSRTLRTWGESESGLAERLAERMTAIDRSAAAGEPAVTIAFLASGIEGLKVRLTAKAETDEAVDALLAAEEAEVRAILGPDLIFGVDHETMEHAVLALMERLGLTLGLAESLTGGLAAARLTDVPGASKVLRGAVVSYATEVKQGLLDVPAGPVVTAAAAEAMASGARAALGADVGLAFTGVAGPDPQPGEDEPPGTVFVGLDIAGEVSSVRLQLPGDRIRVRQFAVISGLGLLRSRLAGRAGESTWA